MATCKNCGNKMDWAFDEDMSKWVPLEPTDTDADLEKRFVDREGNLRADHRSRCLGGNAGLTVTRLRKPIPAEVQECQTQ